MEDHRSCHGSITGDEAICRLKYSGYPHCYLTRFSKKQRSYILTVYIHAQKDAEEHFPLSIMHGRCKIEGKTMEFESIHSLLKHYEVEPINPSVERIGQSYSLEDYNTRQRWIEGNSLGGHSSYHMALTEEDAIERLKQSGYDHCYLTHLSEEQQVYLLTVYRKEQSREIKEHFPIILLRNQFKIEGKVDMFDAIESLLRYYAANSISPRLLSIGHSYSFKEHNTVPNEFQMDHSSYHDTITEEVAMNRLRESDKPHCYLTYCNEEKQAAYQLAVYKRQHPRAVEAHFPIIFQAGKYWIEGKGDNKFDNVESLLNHYGAHRIHPSLANIGTNYTSVEFNALPFQFQMGDHSSYHNAITEEVAINRLRQSDNPHCYLTYFNEGGKYVLAVYKKQHPQDVEVHYPMILRAGKYKIDEKDEKFDDVLSLLNYYERHRISPSLATIGTNYTLQDYEIFQARAENNMMGEHTSYHNQITPQEAMNRLKKSGRRHCYLTYFNREQQKYMLAVYEKQERVEMHYPIIIRGGMHKLEGKPDSFNSIDELLQHYTENRVDPALSRIGENYTLKAYNDKFCIIL